MKLNDSSLRKLQGVHSDLVLIVKEAADITQIDFVVTEGVRTLEKQQILVEKGASKTLKSRHLTGHAVDLAARVNGEIRWDWPLYEKLAEAMKAAAAKLDIPLEWGGGWESFKDGPHFQLPWKDYP